MDGSEDPIADAIVRLLQAEGAGHAAHAGGRTLLDHLIETSAIVRRWEQPLWLQHAALIHSIYGTDVYRRQLVPLSQRRDVVAVAGERAERLAYLFCVTPREPLLAGTHAWAAGDRDAASRDELDCLVLLHMANLAEQARAPDGSPSRWLVRVRELAELLIDSDTVRLPLFIAALASFTEADESLTGRAYRDGVGRGDDVEARTDRLALAAATCAVVPEPCVWLAHAARCRGDIASARSWAGRARERLTSLGTAWDKRLTVEQWLELISAIERAPGSPPHAPLTDPRALFDGLVLARAGDAPRAPVEAEAVAGRERFHRYVESLAGGDASVYPDLATQPWYDADEFHLPRYLVSHYDAIREEILALDPLRFHRESERIKRAGDWDVAFFYERGRRRDEVCDACPVTTRGIEAFEAMRTVAGLIYVSRMRASTHIHPHRGPTNLRVRCHLGISVPDGDCAIRVGAETRHWRDGECLVFDDTFEHEAWNHTADDRIVLIVDMWHPGLSATEVSLLQGLHGYTHAYARRLNRYWSANAAAGAEH